VGGFWESWQAQVEKKGQTDKGNSARSKDTAGIEENGGGNKKKNLGEFWKKGCLNNMGGGGTTLSKGGNYPQAVET